MDYDSKSFGFMPAFNIPALAMIIMSLCKGRTTCTLNVLPDFQPNEYLFEHHKRSGDYHEDGSENERWETFAWAVRDAMIKASGCDQRTFFWSENHLYEKFMSNKKDNEEPPIIERILNSSPFSQNIMGDDEGGYLKIS